MSTEITEPEMPTEVAAAPPPLAGLSFPRPAPPPMVGTAPAPARPGPPSSMIQSTVGAPTDSLTGALLDGRVRVTGRGWWPRRKKKVPKAPPAARVIGWPPSYRGATLAPQWWIVIGALVLAGFVLFAILLLSRQPDIVLVDRSGTTAPPTSAPRTTAPATTTSAPRPNPMPTIACAADPSGQTPMVLTNAAASMLAGGSAGGVVEVLTTAGPVALSYDSLFRISSALGAMQAAGKNPTTAKVWDSVKADDLPPATYAADDPAAPSDAVTLLTCPRRGGAGGQ